MVFGIFDGIHDGHRDFLAWARNQGDYLTVVVAQDHIAENLTGKFPSANLEERFEHLKDEDFVDEVVVGDHASDIWQVVTKYRPDVIALGYNQGTLKESLEEHLPKLSFAVELKVMAIPRP